MTPPLTSTLLPKGKRPVATHTSLGPQGLCTGMTRWLGGKTWEVLPGLTPPFLATGIKQPAPTLWLPLPLPCSPASWGTAQCAHGWNRHSRRARPRELLGRIALYLDQGLACWKPVLNEQKNSVPFKA